MADRSGKPSIRLMDIEEMRDDPRNARTHAPEQLEMLAGLMLEYGYTNPALIDVSADNLIVAGHGRKGAARILRDRGETIALPNGSALPKGKIPFIDVTGWSEEKRRAYALADNQSALLAGWDLELLNVELESLAEFDIDAASLGFTDEALEQLTSNATGEPARQPGELQDSDFEHTDQFGVIVMCTDAKEQQTVFERLRDEGLNVKVVVV
jgi:ParB-like chromosome segregation protein Spo0J